VIAGNGDNSRAHRRWQAVARPSGQEPPMSETGAAADFDAFYATTSRRVVRHAYALTGDLADAQDVAQEAFARAWQRWDSVRGYDSPEAWVRRVATNLATSRLRRKRTARAARGPLAGHLVPEISLDTVALVAGLRTLPERQRVVLVLHYLADLPVNQIALELQCPVGSVKAWLSRGRDALAAAMSEASDGRTHRTGSVRPASSEVADA
jgi:RNA polymerase sigma-70 factor (ECF subfamily)